MKNEKFTHRFNLLIKEMDVRQVDICNSTGISKDKINKYMKGKMVPGNIPLYKLAKYFNVDSLYLLGIKDEKETSNNYILEEIKMKLEKMNDDQLADVNKFIDTFILK